MRSFACRVCERESHSSSGNVCVCVCVCSEGDEVTHSPACLQKHMSFITVFVTHFCSPFELELMVKLMTLLTVFTLVLKAEAHDYGKGVTFLTRLVVFGQSQCTVTVGQSEQTVHVGNRDFVENEAFERGGA